MTRVRRSSANRLRLRAGRAAMSALWARLDLEFSLDLASVGLVLGDELHAGGIHGSDTGDLPRSLRCFEGNDLKARLAA
jgi:hypothetical protein